MKFAVNYSKPLAALVDEGLVDVDLYKLPGWPDAVAQARAQRPAYVHFPLTAGPDGIINGETGNLVDWSYVEGLLEASDTSFVNVHFAPKATMYPDIDPFSVEPAHVERITEDTINAVNTAVNYFGAEKIIVENTPDAYGLQMRACTLPEAITRVITETGTGLLLDISHARLAANALEMDSKEYINALPLNRIREIHITGLQHLEAAWLDRLEAVGIKTSMFHPFVGKLIDHLPLTDDDWVFHEWAFEQLHNGAWQKPEIIALEYGGIGGVWEIIADRDVLLAQVPRLQAMLFQQKPV